MCCPFLWCARRMVPAISKLVLSILEGPARAQTWHVACTHTSGRQIESTVVGVERGTHGRSQKCECATSIILEPEEDV
jgi:hypothetical protein